MQFFGVMCAVIAGLWVYHHPVDVKDGLVLVFEAGIGLLGIYFVYRSYRALMKTKPMIGFVEGWRRGRESSQPSKGDQ